MPPAAMIGTSTLLATSGSSTIVGDVARVLEAAALAALDHQAVDAGVDRLQRRGQRGHDVEHGEPGRLQLRGVLGGVAGRGGDEPHALVDDEVDDRRVAHERLGDVHAERLVGEIAHLADLVADVVELAAARSR